MGLSWTVKQICFALGHTSFFQPSGNRGRGRGRLPSHRPSKLVRTHLLPVLRTYYSVIRSTPYLPQVPAYTSSAVPLPALGPRRPEAPEIPRTAGLAHRGSTTMFRNPSGPLPPPTVANLSNSQPEERQRERERDRSREREADGAAAAASDTLAVATTILVYPRSRSCQTDTTGPRRIIAKLP